MCGECLDPEKGCLDPEKKCLDPDKFECKWYGETVCLTKSKYQCDGRIDDCDDGVDELPALCGKCNDTEKFECDVKFHGQSQSQTFCLSKDHHQCNGVMDCEDGRDEQPSVCEECCKNDCDNENSEKPFSVCDECAGRNLTLECGKSDSQCVRPVYVLFLSFLVASRALSLM